MAQLTLLVDLDRCVGCHSCAVACKQAHGVPPGVARMQVRTVGPYGAFPAPDMYFLPVMCQHCDDPPCLEACPSEAIFKRDDGVVLVDSQLCDGCAICVTACPYQALFVRPDTNVADACTLCVERSDPGAEPFCVSTCVTRALAFGDLDNQGDPLVERVKGLKDHIFTLQAAGRPGVPRTLYVLRRQRWRGEA